MLLILRRFLVTTALLFLAISFAKYTPGIAAETSTPFAADRAWTEAIAKSDRAAIEKLSDLEFTWTERTGKTRAKAELLMSLGSLDSSPDAEVSVENLGKIVLVRGVHRYASQNDLVRFNRVWVERPQGWRLLVYQETTKAEMTPEKRSGFGSPSDGGPVACENPCKSVPYKPAGAAEQEVVGMWQAVERTVLTNDVEAWIPNFTDDFIFVTPDGGPPLNKADRVANDQRVEALQYDSDPCGSSLDEGLGVW